MILFLFFIKLEEQSDEQIETTSDNTDKSLEWKPITNSEIILTLLVLILILIVAFRSIRYLVRPYISYDHYWNSE